MSSNGSEEVYEGRENQAEGANVASNKQDTTPLLLNEYDSIPSQNSKSFHEGESCNLINSEGSGIKCETKGDNSSSVGISSSASNSGLTSNVADIVKDNASCKSSSSTITCEEDEVQEILNEREEKMDRLVGRGEIVRSSDEDDGPDSRLLRTGNSKLINTSKDDQLLNKEKSQGCNLRKTTDDLNIKRSNTECYALNLNEDGINICGSPSSDVTEPELAKVNLNYPENWSSSDRKSCKDSAYSDSPSSEFECSASSSAASCAEDSGISSTVRDDEMEEIPLADGSYSPNLFQEMSRMSVDDMVSSWVPKSKNTYAPSITTRSSGSVTKSLLEGDSTEGRHQPQQSKIKEIFSKSAGETNQNTIGWKLFGKIPPKESSKPHDLTSFSRDDVKRRSLGEQTAPRKPKFLSLKRNSSAVPSSTTALIFENRPRNLPAKSPTEERKHRQQYETMVAQARKKELQDAKKKEKELKVKSKQEKVITCAAGIWMNEILPNWETMKTSRRAKELWWQGIPPSVRGRVWKLAIGNDLQITNELFDIFQAHAYEKLIITRNNKMRLKEPKSVAELPTNNFIPVVNSEHKVELIMLDVSRTFPSLCIFQEGGPFHDVLHSILGAYTCYRPDVGYVQGMSFIAAVLLLNMDPPDAFVCFANLLNKPCQLVFFRVDHPMMKAYFATFEILLEEFLPKIGKLFLEENFSPDMYLIDWIFTLFSKALPLDVACRVWDVFCRDGDDFLFRTALGILKFYQSELMGMDFIHLGQFLSKLPDDIQANKLFDCISSVNLNRHKFNQILAQQKELATQIKTVTASAGVK